MQKRAVLLFPEKENCLAEEFFWFLGQETDLNCQKSGREITIFDGDSVIKISVLFENRIIQRLDRRGIKFSQQES